MGYTQRFFDNQRVVSHRSAVAVVPAIIEFLKPRSVIDVGCGLGTWLLPFLESGIEDVMGVDGAWVDETKLEIPRGKFLKADLAKPLKIDRTFDIAMSLEVAEHLPESAADGFVESLTKLSRVVIFSASIPLQGGVGGGTGHINEQWQDYWAGRFMKRGYVPIDYLRPRVWDNPDVEFFYAQNTLIYVDEGLARSDQKFQPYRGQPLSMPLRVVHPNGFMNMTRPDLILPRHFIKAFPTVMGRFVKFRLRRLFGR